MLPLTSHMNHTKRTMGLLFLALAACVLTPLGREDASAHNPVAQLAHGKRYGALKQPTPNAMTAANRRSRLAAGRTGRPANVELLRQPAEASRGPQSRARFSKRRCRSGRATPVRACDLVLNFVLNLDVSIADRITGLDHSTALVQLSGLPIRVGRNGTTAAPKPLQPVHYSVQDEECWTHTWNVTPQLPFRVSSLRLAKPRGGGVPGVRMAFDAGSLNEVVTHTCRDGDGDEGSFTTQQNLYREGMRVLFPGGLVDGWKQRGGSLVAERFVETEQYITRGRFDLRPTQCPKDKRAGTSSRIRGLAKACARLIKAVCRRFPHLCKKPPKPPKPPKPKGFKSFKAFKKAMGPAGKGKQWHHIVGQHEGNINRFGPEKIHNTANLVRVDKKVHEKISGYYSSRQDFTKGKTVRDWLSTQSYEAQYRFGRRILDRFRRK